MARKKEIFVCSACGHIVTKWMGQCPECGSWNTMEEQQPQEITGAGKIPEAKPVKTLVPLSEIVIDQDVRYVTGISEFDRVMGGGLVRDSVTILAARPGAGKSTLMLQVAQSLAEAGKRVLYVSGEESESQIRRRAERVLKKIHERIWVYSTTSMNQALGAVQNIHPHVIMIDSIQTMTVDEIPSRPGSPTQVMECADLLMKLAKNQEAPRAVLMAGQLTKEDELAGVRALEHLVDTVLYIEPEPDDDLRMLQATKNRFGSTGEMGFFTMEEDGLKSIENPSEFFMTHRNAKDRVAGSALTVIREGTRPVIVEIEALVSRSYTPYPLRIADCMKRDHLMVLLSILEQRGGKPLYDQNVVVKTTGGLKLSGQEGHLAVIMAILSSAIDQGMPTDYAYIGDVGLTGELKRVPQMEPRIRELERMGFCRVYVPERSMKSETLKKYPQIEVRQLRTLAAVMYDVFGDFKSSLRQMKQQEV